MAVNISRSLRRSAMAVIMNLMIVMKMVGRDREIKRKTSPKMYLVIL
jgi:hypothetical protein